MVELPQQCDQLKRKRAARIVVAIAFSAQGNREGVVIWRLAVTRLIALRFNVMRMQWSFLLPGLKLLFEMLFQQLELVLVILPTPPARHIPAWPVSRQESLASFRKRELMHLY